MLLCWHNISCLQWRTRLPIFQIPHMIFSLKLSNKKSLPKWSVTCENAKFFHFLGNFCSWDGLSCPPTSKIIGWQTGTFSDQGLQDTLSLDSLEYKVLGLCGGWGCFLQVSLALHAHPYLLLSVYVAFSFLLAFSEDLTRCFLEGKSFSLTHV